MGLRLWGSTKTQLRAHIDYVMGRADIKNLQLKYNYINKLQLLLGTRGNGILMTQQLLTFTNEIL